MNHKIYTISGLILKNKNKDVLERENKIGKKD